MQLARGTLASVIESRLGIQIAFSTRVDAEGYAFRLYEDPTDLPIRPNTYPRQFGKGFR